MSKNISANLTLALSALLFIAIIGVFSGLGSDVKNTPSTTESSYEVSFNRYQAGFVCRERGWEFCVGWSYTHSRIA